MKKIFTTLLTLLMIFTLVGCNSKKEEPTIEVNEPVVEQKQEFVEETPKQEEPTIEVTTEEPIQEETKPLVSLDPSQYSYWVVVYDQYDNEISRTTAKYGTTVKDPSGKDVIVKGNTYFHTTIDYPSPKNKDDGPTPSPTPTPTPDPSDVNYFYIKNTGSSASTVSLTQHDDVANSLDAPTVSLLYSLDKETWNDFSSSITLNENETAYFKAKTTNGPFAVNPSGGYNSFEFVNGKIELGGSIMTLLDPTDTLRDLSSYPNAFTYLFFNDAPAMQSKLESISNLSLPATKLGSACYKDMFKQTHVTSSPTLPAMELADECYESMFLNCLFFSQAPVLPATVMKDNCYAYMFSGCTFLSNAPELNSTSLAPSCYWEMFGSTRITSIILPASTLAENCYGSMFYNCDYLTSVQVGFDNFDSLPNNATWGWFEEVNSTGTFKWPGATTGITQDISHVPYGWTITN